MERKQEQVLLLDPAAELVFKGPFSEVVSSLLTLSNPTDKKVFFKVKTTAPRKYCVRPNSGEIAPNGAVKVHVMLQPFLYDPNEKNKHKFMVQSIFAPENGDIVLLDQYFKDALPHQLMDSKLRCVFEVPADKIQNNIDASSNAMAMSKPEPAKVSPKINNAEAELSKALEEIQRLNLEHRKLVNENITLKEDAYSFRSTQGTTSDSKKSPLTQLVVEQPRQEQSTMMLMIIALIVAFIGYLCGKFF